PVSPLPRPIDPATEMLRLQLVTLHLLTAGFGIDSVQVQPVRTANKRVRLIQGAAQLLTNARPAGIAASHSQPAPQFAIATLKSRDIVTLPAVQANGNLLQPPQGLPHIHAKGGILLTGDVVCVLNLLLSHGKLHVIAPMERLLPRISRMERLLPRISQ